MSWPETLVSPKTSSCVKTQKFSQILKDISGLYIFSPLTILAFDRSLFGQSKPLTKFNIHLWQKTNKQTKNLQKAGIEGTYLNIIKAIYDKPTANILNGEKLKAFPLKSGTRQGYALTTTIQHSFGNIGHSNQSRKRIKGIQIGKEEVKISLFADSMIFYIGNPKDSTRKLL